MECHPQDQSPELSTPDNSSSLNALIQGSCGEPFPWPEESAGEGICSSACLFAEA